MHIYVYTGLTRHTCKQDGASLNSAWAASTRDGADGRSPAPQIESSFASSAGSAEATWPVPAAWTQNRKEEYITLNYNIGSRT